MDQLQLYEEIPQKSDGVVQLREPFGLVSEIADGSPDPATRSVSCEKVASAINPSMTNPLTVSLTRDPGVITSIEMPNEA
jgi:hypothetical protein